MYLSTRIKFAITALISLSWMAACAWLALPWIADLAHYVTFIPACLIIFLIALAPGYMYMFLLVGYLIDKRVMPPLLADDAPNVSILIAAFNEAEHIAGTLNSIRALDYPGKVQIIVIDDGSSDDTVFEVEKLGYDNILLLQQDHQGKSAALNLGLANAEYDIVATLDADTFLAKDSLAIIMAQLQVAPKNTAAIAGSVYVKNSRKNIMTRIQEWDYFHAIAAIKRVQSLFQGTLVAQGAFSIYRKEIVTEMGGWSDHLGEDIVLTWHFLENGYRVGFCDKAFAFTNVPESYGHFFSQRSRWARGMLEAFVHCPKILLTPRQSAMFIYWNLLFPAIDFAFLLIFIPGIIAAFFGYFYIAGPMTLAVLPLAVITNLIFYFKQKKVFDSHDYKIRNNKFGLFLYVFFYQFIMLPAVIHGYLSQWLGRKQTWGGE